MPRLVSEVSADKVSLEILECFSSGGYLGDYEGRFTRSVIERKTVRNPSLLEELKESLYIDIELRETDHFRVMIVRGSAEGGILRLGILIPKKRGIPYILGLVKFQGEFIKPLRDFHLVISEIFSPLLRDISELDKIIDSRDFTDFILNIPYELLPLDVEFLRIYSSIRRAFS